MLFSDYLVNEGSNFLEPFQITWTSKFNKVINSMDTSGIQDKTNVISFFLYNYILKNTLGAAVPEINEYLENNVFDKIEKAECSSVFYTPDKIGKKEFKEILKKPDELLDFYMDSGRASFNPVKVIANGKNSLYITSRVLFNCKIFGEYEIPENKKELEYYINKKIEKHLKEQQEIGRHFWKTDIEPILNVLSYQVPRDTNIQTEIEFSSKGFLRYSVTIFLEKNKI